MKTLTDDTNDIQDQSSPTSYTDPESDETKEQETDHLDSDDALHNDDDIESDEDLHEKEAGNVGEPEAEKDMLSGPANDLIGRPAAKNDEE